MRKVTVLAAALVLVFAACGDDQGEPTTEATENPPQTESPRAPAASSVEESDGVEFEDLADNVVAKYGPGRYRADRLDPITHFTIEESWLISDFHFELPDDVGFSGSRPGSFGDEKWESVFVGIWPATSWCDVTTDTNVVFDQGEMATAIESDVRLADVAASEVTVGSRPATRIDARVKAEYLESVFHLGRTQPRDVGDIPGCEQDNVISDSGNASERVIFWAIEVDGIDLAIYTTYPPELADEFEPMVDNLVDSVAFEPVSS